MSTTNDLTPPAIGEVWIGQGGIYAGVIPGRNGAPSYHLIIGEEIGQFAWGPYREEAESSLIDGVSNTASLLQGGPEYAAAQAAASYQADGLTDFYLPAIAELNEAWLNLGDRPWGWVWSSSQRAKNVTYIMGFEGGGQNCIDKDYQYRVRPARRLAIQ